MPLLELNEVEIRYGDVVVNRNISFTLDRGKILGIVGESGSGKSTLIRGIMKILGSNGLISGGKIIFGGKNLAEISQEEMRRLRGPDIGMIFQNPGMAFLPLRNIESQFYEAIASHQRLNKKEAKCKILELFEKLNLIDGERILKSYPFQLSGGMNQRVNIALSMILKPSLLLGDEPTSSLDVLAQAQVVEEMMKLREEFETSIIVVSHNMGVIAHMADTIGVMYSGDLVEFGAKDELLKNPAHFYTRALIEAIPQGSGSIPKGIPGIPPNFSEYIEGCRYRKRCENASNKCREIPQITQVSKTHNVRCHNYRRVD